VGNRSVEKNIRKLDIWLMRREKPMSSPAKRPVKLDAKGEKRLTKKERLMSLPAKRPVKLDTKGEKRLTKKNSVR
jgi:hypothetical protein